MADIFFSLVERIDVIGSGRGVRWFDRELARKVENGMRTVFWKEGWLSNAPLCVTFPRLFSLANNQEWTVGDI